MGGAILLLSYTPLLWTGASLLFNFYMPQDNYISLEAG